MKWWVMLSLLLVGGCDQLFGFTHVPSRASDGGLDASGSADALPPARGWLSLEPGTDHTCGLDISGRLLCSPNGSFTPMPFDPMNRTWTQLSTGHDHSCGIVSTGDLLCWGGDTFGEIDGTPSTTPVPAPASTGPLGHVWKRVAAGGYHTCALATDGSVWCWGNSQQTGGNGSTGFHQMQGSFGGLSAGVDHTCALDDLGHVLCWGADGNGQSSGNGSCDTTCVAVNVPLPVGTLSGVTAVSAGKFATCAIANGNVTCWGSNERFDPEMSFDAPPTLIQGGGQWTAIAVGDEATCGIEAGSVRCWGTQNAGGLGDGMNRSILAPSAADDLGPADHISLTRARDNSEEACAVSSGSASCWGPPVRPTAVPDPSGV